MKAFSQIFVTMIFVALFSFPLKSQPCLHVNAEPAAPCIAAGASITSGSNEVNFRIEQITAGLDMGVPPSVQPRYKAFWIFGDGNFRHFPSNLEYAGDIATLSQSYTFPTGYAIYPTTVLLTEKKSNTSPPPEGKRQIGVSPPNPKTPAWQTSSPFRYQIASPRNMDIFNSDFNRPDYSTAFVVSAPKNDARITKMLFFFNNIKIGDAGSFLPDTIHDPDHNFSINLPNYFENQTTSVQGTEPVFNSLNYDVNFYRGVSEFLNFAEVSVPDSIRVNIPAAFTEIRFFPILRSVWDETWIQPDGPDPGILQDTLLPVARYLALSLGTEPLYPDDSPDSSEKSAFFDEVQTYFPLMDDLNLRVTNDSPALYIRGIHVMEVEMVASIDPNGIQIVKVCPIGKDKYQVRLKLEVCNEGYMHEKDFTFRLTDHTELLSEPNFSGDPAIQSFPPALVTAGATTWAYQWNTYLEAVPYPYAGTDPAKLVKPDNTCAQTEFMVETNWEGVQALIDGKALELCVKFTYGKEKCTLNSPLSSREYCREAGYKCGDCPKSVVPEYCCNWIFYGLILLFLILLVLIWVLWALLKRKKNHNT